MEKEGGMNRGKKEGRNSRRRQGESEEWLKVPYWPEYTAIDISGNWVR